MSSNSSANFGRCIIKWKGDELLSKLVDSVAIVGFMNRQRAFNTLHQFRDND
jgi:hypothetical protein